MIYIISSLLSIIILIYLVWAPVTLLCTALFIFSPHCDAFEATPLHGPQRFFNRSFTALFRSVPASPHGVRSSNDVRRSCGSACNRRFSPTSSASPTTRSGRTGRWSGEAERRSVGGEAGQWSGAIVRGLGGEGSRFKLGFPPGS